MGDLFGLEDMAATKRRKAASKKTAKSKSASTATGTSAKRSAGRKPSRKARAATHEVPKARTDTATAPLETRIGEVIRQQRMAANVTLASLGQGCGISSAMLSRIENGMASASLDSLERICSALGIGMANLFQEVDQKTGEAQLLKTDEQMEVVRVGTQYGYRYALLSYNRGPRKTFEPFLVEMNKQSEAWPRFSHPGTEFIFMLEGKLEYRFGDKIYLLEPGDTLTFAGNVVHGPERMLADYVKFIAVIVYDE